MYIGLQVQYRYSCQVLMKLQFSQQIFEKYSNTKFLKSPSSANRVVPCGQTDMTKVIIAFFIILGTQLKYVLKEVRFDIVDWIYLARCGDQW